MTRSTYSPDPARIRRFSRTARWLITLVVVLLVVWFAGDTLRRAWEQLSAADLRISLGWSCVAAIVYVTGLAPMAGYWWLVLRSLGEAPPAFAVLRGYYFGHLGKYVPGKALVVVLRTGLLHAAGCNARAVVVSVFLETLTFMATGAALAAALLATRSEPSLPHLLLAVGLSAVAGLPVTPPIAKWLARHVLKDAPATTRDPSDSLAGITWRLAVCGLAASAVSWTILGLSLWAALRAVGIESARPLGELGLWIQSVTLPMVAGFLSLIPGGLVVRDALITQLLTPQIAAHMALVAAALWRVISIVSEVVVCGMLEVYRLARADRSKMKSSDTSS